MVVVTGATGHIGNVLIRELLAKGKRIRAVIPRPIKESIVDTIQWFRENGKI